MRSKLASLVFVFTTLLTLKADANILSNGDFELGTPAGAFLRVNAGATDLTGWTILPDQVDIIGTFYQAASGGRSVDLDGNFGISGGVGQAFATTPGEVYNLSFAMAGNIGGAPVIKTMTVQAAGISMDFSFDTTGHTSTDMGWEVKTWSFMATDVLTNLEFISTTIPAGLGPMIDDVVLVNANAGIEVFPLPPDPIIEVTQGADDPREPKVRVGVAAEDEPEFYVRITGDADSSGGKVEAGECYNVYWDGRPHASSGFLCGSLTGIDVWRMRVSFYFPEAGDITLEPKFFSSSFPSPDCQAPDEEQCAGPETTFTITTPGTYTLSMPMDCVCALLDDVYFLTICVVDKTPTVGPFITTSASGGAACLSYVDLGTGDGWEDAWVKFPSLPGPFQISGTAACCEAPIGIDPKSWGEIKSEYGGMQP